MKDKDLTLEETETSHTLGGSMKYLLMYFVYDNGEIES